MFVYKISDKDRIRFEQAISILNHLKAPITDEAIIVYTHSRSFGLCMKDRDHKFKIYINKGIIGDEKFVNTAIHELLHTIDNTGYKMHSGNWKKWANIVSSKTQYKITISDSISKLNYTRKIGQTTTCTCTICGRKCEILSKSIKTDGKAIYMCRKCNKPLFVSLPESPIKDLSIDDREKYINEMIHKKLTIDDIVKCLYYSSENGTKKLIKYYLHNFEYDINIYSIMPYISKDLKKDLADEYCNGIYNRYIQNDNQRCNFEAIFANTEWFINVTEHSDKVFGPLGNFKNSSIN